MPIRVGHLSPETNRAALNRAYQGGLGQHYTQQQQLGQRQQALSLQAAGLQLEQQRQAQQAYQFEQQQLGSLLSDFYGRVMDEARLEDQQAHQFELLEAQAAARTRELQAKSTFEDEIAQRNFDRSMQFLDQELANNKLSQPEYDHLRQKLQLERDGHDARIMERDWPQDENPNINAKEHKMMGSDGNWYPAQKDPQSGKWEFTELPGYVERMNVIESQNKAKIEAEQITARTKAAEAAAKAQAEYDKRVTEMATTLTEKYNDNLTEDPDTKQTPPERSFESFISDAAKAIDKVDQALGRGMSKHSPNYAAEVRRQQAYETNPTDAARSEAVDLPAWLHESHPHILLYAEELKRLMDRYGVKGEDGKWKFTGGPQEAKQQIEWLSQQVSPFFVK